MLKLHKILIINKINIRLAHTNYFCVAIFLTFLPCYVQAQSMTSMMRALKKQNFQGVYRKADKLIEKDSLHVGALFMKCLFFNDLQNKLFNPDSAYFYLQRTKETYPYISKPLEIELDEVGINLEKIQLQKSEIEKAKFDYRVATTQERKSQKNLLQTLSSSEQLSAEELYLERYLVAQRLNTYEAYQRFIDKYPEAPQYQEATLNYERLLYKAETHARTAEAFEQFIRNYPKSQYVKVAEEQLFNALLIDHSREVYETILAKKELFSEQFITRVLGLWWFIEKDKLYFFSKCPELYKNLFQKYHDYLDTEIFPVWNDGKIILIDRKGQIKQSFKHKKYVCTDEIKHIILSEKRGLFGAYDYTGKLILPHEFNDIKLINDELIQVKKGNKYGIFHRFGFPILENIYDEINLLSDTYIRTKSGNKYGLYLINGRALLPTKFDNIELLVGDTLRVDWEFQTATLNQNALVQYGDSIENSHFFRWKNPQITHEKYVIIESGGLYEIYDMSGKLIVPIRGETITEIPTGWIIQYDKKLYFFNIEEKHHFSLDYDQVIPHTKFVALRKGKKWTAYNYKKKALIDLEYDQVQDLGKAGFLFMKGDEFYFLHESEDFKFLGKYKNVSIRYTDTQSSLWDAPKEITKIYFITEDKRGKKGVIRYNGSHVLPNKYTEITFEDNKIIAELNSKKGLYNLNGGELLPLRYRGIVHRGDGYFATFAGRGFGFYHHEKHIEFPPFYEIMPRCYGKWNTYFIVKKSKLGLVGTQNNLVAPFRFDEIRAWTKDVILVRNNHSWRFFDIQKQTYI